MAKWNSYTPISGGLVADADLVPYSDEGEAAGSKSKVVSVATLRTVLSGASNVTTTDPGVGDDDADGYRVGSIWLNTTDGGVFVCTSAATGAATWAEVSPATLHKYDATVAPTANEDTGDGYSVGSIWVDVTADKAYICLDATLTAAVWTEITAAGGGGTPGGSDTQLQYNNGGTFGGIAGFTYDDSTHILRSDIEQTTTPADPGPVQANLRIARDANYTGGTAGQVHGGIYLTNIVRSGVTAYEWGLTSVLENYAAVGENVAIYAQGNNRVSGGTTWALALEAQDITGDAATLVGAEILLKVNGADASGNRVALDVLAGKYNSGGALGEVGYGIRLAPQDNDTALGRFDVGLSMTAINEVGLDYIGTVATAAPIRLKGAASQSESFIRVLDNADVLRFAVQSAGTVDVRPAASATSAFSAGVSSDASARYALFASGQQAFGPGDASRDVFLERVAPTGGSGLEMEAATRAEFSLLTTGRTDKSRIQQTGGTSEFSLLMNARSDGSAYYRDDESIGAGQLYVGGNANGFLFRFAAAGAGAITWSTPLKITPTKSVVVGDAALATSATDGFLYIPTTAGAPTGAPTAQTGTAALVLDSTNNRLYVRNGATWRYAALT